MTKNEYCHIYMNYFCLSVSQTVLVELSNVLFDLIFPGAF